MVRAAAIVTNVVMSFRSMICAHTYSSSRQSAFDDGRFAWRLLVKPHVRNAALGLKTEQAMA
jgi:hypothetical protein